MTAPTVSVDAEVNNGTATKTFVWTPGGGAPATGKGLYAFFLYDAAGSPTWTDPSGWTLDRSGTILGGAVAFRSYYKLAGGSEPSSYTWTGTTASNFDTYGMGMVVSGNVNRADFRNATSTSNTGTSGSVVSTGLTTTVDDCLIMLLGGVGDAAADFGPPAGYTEDRDGTLTFASHVTTAPAAGAVSNQTTTKSAGSHWFGLMVAFEPVAAGTTTRRYSLTLTGVG